MIPIQGSFNGFVGLTGVVYVDLIESSLDLENILGMPLDIRSLPLEAARWLVDHDAGIGQRKPRALLARGEQKRTHRRRLSNAHRCHFGTNKLHRVVDREPRRNNPPWGIDVKSNFLLRIISLDKKQLSDYQRSRDVVDRTDHENDAFAQQPRENIERTLAPRRLLDNNRHKIIGIIVDEIAHWSPSLTGNHRRWAAGASSR